MKYLRLTKLCINAIINNIRLKKSVTFFKINGIKILGGESYGKKALRADL